MSDHVQLLKFGSIFLNSQPLLPRDGGVSPPQVENVHILTSKAQGLSLKIQMDLHMVKASPIATTLKVIEIAGGQANWSDAIEISDLQM